MVEYREVNALDAGPSPDDDPHLEDYEDEYVPKFENKGDEQIFFDEDHRSSVGNGRRY